MTNPIQKASIIDAKSQPVQNAPTPVVNNSPEYERQNLKDLVSLQLKELLFKEVLKNNLENETKIKGKISINFLNNRQNPNSIPVRDITLQTLPYNIDKVTNLILANKNYNAYILPFVSDNGGAEQCNVMGGESLIIDLDEGNTDEKLKLITQTFGTPSIILKSGSIVNGEYPCKHIYYKFDEYLSGDRFKKLLDIRGKIAKGFGGDVAYARNSAQLVRIFGSFNHKKGTKRVSEIEQNNLATAIYTFDDFCITADKYFGENPIVEKNIQQQLALTTTSTDEETAESLEFPIHQPPLELNDGQVIDYLNALVPDIFAKGNYDLWLKAIFATFHQYKGSEKGKQIFKDFSLQDKSRSEKEIIDSINQHWKYSKCEKTNQKVTTFRTIIDIVNNKDFVEKEIAKNPSFGSLIRVFDTNDMFGDTYVLTDKYLLVKITKGSGKNQITYLKHISDYIDVLGTGYSDSNKVYTLVKVKDRKASEILKTIPIGVKPSDLRLFLINKLNFKFEDSNSSFAYLQKYLLAREEKNTQINIVNRLGWTEENNVYLLPYKKNKKDDIKIYSVDKTDKCNSNYYLETTTKSDECLAKKGSLKDWRENICKYAFGNDLMSFCLFIPFASSWYKPLAEQPLIFHIYGESRKGKTILLNLSSSILGFSGNLGYSNWNSTLVALENLAAIKNDNLLILDELHSCTSDRVLTEAPYLFVNSRGKSRGAKNQEEDSNLASRKWQVQVLSSGENSFESELIKRNQLVRGGHRNRVIDIPAVVGDLGVFNTIHDFDKQFTGEDKAKEKGLKLFVDHLEKSALKYKGTAIEAYFEYIFNTKTHSDILVDIRNLKLEWENQYLFSLKSLSTKNMGDISSRANNFATIAASAVIACDAGILPFNKEYVFSVVGKIFHNYLNSIRDVYLTADDRAIKDLLVKFLNNNLHSGFVYNGYKDGVQFNDNSFNFNGNYGIKVDKREYNVNRGELPIYEYYLSKNRLEDIFKGFPKTIVQRFLKEHNYILPNPLKKPNIDFTHEIYHKGFRKKVNYYLLNLTAIGITTPDDEDDPEPTPPTDKLKDLPCETTSEASEPIVVNTVTQNISAVTNTTAVESNVNSTFKPKWCIREKNELLDYLEPYYQEGREITYFEFQTSDLREWDKFSLHELVKPLFAIGIKGELDTKPQLFRIRNVKLTQLERETLTKCIFREAVIRERGDLLAYLQTYDNLSLNFSFKAIDEDFAKPEHIQELYFKGQFDNQVQIFKLDNGYLSESEQSAWSRIKCVWTDKHYPTTKENFYFPFNCYDYCSIAFEYWFPFLKEQIEAAISQKLKVKVQFKNYIMRSRADLASISAGCFQEYVMCAGIVEGDAKNPDNLKYLLLKKKNEKPIVIKLENGLTKEEQEILKPLELVFSKINMDTEQYLPNLNYNWVHFLDIALLTRNSDTNMIQTLKEPFYILQENTNLEELLSAISNDLIKNEGIFSKIEPEILNEFRYRDSIINEYDKLRHVPY